MQLQKRCFALEMGNLSFVEISVLPILFRVMFYLPVTTVLPQYEIHCRQESAIMTTPHDYVLSNDELSLQFPLRNCQDL
jgi:hypothetical protein